MMNEGRAGWQLRLYWLLGLWPFFFLSYGWANHLASQLPEVASIQFDWERQIPFIEASIWPYWSLNLLYLLALFVPKEAQAVRRLGLRLLSAQLIAVTAFFLFPLRCQSVWPEVSGWSGLMFELLGSFDQPYNQSPSLHVIMSLLLWDLYSRLIPLRWRWMAHIWFTLIGLSVLTTYQHHVIDIPSGLIVAAFCLWLWPETGPSPAQLWRLSPDPARRQLASYYGLAALGCLLLALGLSGWAWLLIYPALSLAIVSLIYLGLGAEGFQKTPQGQFSVGATLLLASYLLGVAINSRLRPLNQPPVPVADGLYLGNAHLAAQLAKGATAGTPSDQLGLFDLTAELPAPQPLAAYQSLPLLDLCVPDTEQLVQAVRQLERKLAEGPLLLYCALDYSRSLMVAIAWLYCTGRVDSLAQAEERLSSYQPQLMLPPPHRAKLAELPLLNGASA